MFFVKSTTYTLPHEAGRIEIACDAHGLVGIRCLEGTDLSKLTPNMLIHFIAKCDEVRKRRLRCSELRIHLYEGVIRGEELFRGSYYSRSARRVQPKPHTETIQVYPRLVPPAPLDGILNGLQLLATTVVGEKPQQQHARY